MVLPFVWEILTSFKTNLEVSSLPPTLLPANPTVGWIRDVLRVGAVLDAVHRLRGVADAASRRAGGSSPPSPATRSRACTSPGGTCIFALFLLMLMVPSQLFLLGQFELMKNLDSAQHAAGPRDPRDLLGLRHLPDAPGVPDDAEGVRGGRPPRRRGHSAHLLERHAADGPADDRGARRAHLAVLVERPAVAAHRHADRGQPAADRWGWRRCRGSSAPTTLPSWRGR